MEKQTLQNRHAKIISTVVATKSQTNTFGKYKYRSCEDILEAVKPHLNGLSLKLSDEPIMIGDRYYVKAIAALIDGDGSISSHGYAREQQTKKGMDEAQITGSASSYARKYALQGLFCLDDNKDPDATNKHGADESKNSNETNDSDDPKQWVFPSGEFKDMTIKKLGWVESQDYLAKIKGREKKFQNKWLPEFESKMEMIKKTFQTKNKNEN